MLYEILFANLVGFGMGQQRTDTLQLMIAWPDGLFRFLFGLMVFLYGHLSIMLQYIAETRLCQNVFPEIGSAQSVGIDRIASTIIHALVERQEPAFCTTELSTHLNIYIVNGKMHSTAFVHKEQVFGITVGTILPHSISSVLYRNLVLQLHGDNRQTIDK